jgi:hypothetical protein
LATASIAEHQDDPVALADAERGQPGRDAVRAFGHLREADLLFVATLIDDPQRGAVVALLNVPGRAAPAGNDVEPVGGPVESPGELRPCERRDGLVIVAD